MARVLCLAHSRALPCLNMPFLDPLELAGLWPTPASICRIACPIAATWPWQRLQPRSTKPPQRCHLRRAFGSAASGGEAHKCTSEFHRCCWPARSRPFCFHTRPYHHRARFAAAARRGCGREMSAGSAICGRRAFIPLKARRPPGAPAPKPRGTPLRPPQGQPAQQRFRDLAKAVASVYEFLGIRRPRRLRDLRRSHDSEPF